VRSREAGSIKISTYFFPDDDKFSEIFLEGAEGYLKVYSDLLGEYPYTKFDIVQNFFSSGYGFPTFTLLAPEAIRQGKEFLRPGALDHEIVHSWWGHSVMNKPGDRELGGGPDHLLRQLLLQRTEDGGGERPKIPAGSDAEVRDPGAVLQGLSPSRV
jgi:hypothetical protein